MGMGHIDGMGMGEWECKMGKWLVLYGGGGVYGGGFVEEWDAE